MSERFKVAGVQMDVELAHPQHNRSRMKQFFQTATSHGARLVVFPECVVTGYCYESLQEALEVAETPDGPSVREVAQWCADRGAWVVFGLLERDQSRLFNALACVGPEGLAGWYRKAHLPFLGVDRFVTPGDRPFQVTVTPLANLGMNICYDSSFPEAARALSLLGADLITLPTNWPSTSGLTADVIPQARALENHVYFMAINRIGSERGFEFIGKSSICDPRGGVLAAARHQDEEILYAEINPLFARQKHLVNIPDKHEVHRIRDRRPDLYGPLVEPRFGTVPE